MSKSTEVTEVKSNGLAPVTGDDLTAWGAPAVSSQDIIIPKIYCMQGLSQLVVDEKAKMGDFVDSMTNEVIGNYTKQPLDIIPFHLDKIWIISKKASGSNDFEFDRIEQVTPENEGMPYTEIVDEVEYKNEYCLNFYVLRPEDMSLPYIVAFKGMSRKAGKVLATQMFVRNAAAGKIPPAYVMELGGTKDKNDKGTFITLNTKVKRESSEEEVATAFRWFKTVNAGGVKAHEEQLESGKEETRF